MENENKKEEQMLQLINEPNLKVDLFGNKESFEHIQRVATMFSKSDMLPKRYMGNVGNCIIALEMAHRIGASPLMVMQNLDIILGRPAWSSTFLIATLNASGKFSPLRYENDNENGGRCRAWAMDKINNEKVYGAWVSMEMANAEGWISKSGSKWKTMPELMMRYRAASFFTKQFAPEISMGLQTVEEIYDISPIQKGIDIDRTNDEKERKRILDHLAICETKDEIDILEGSIGNLNEYNINNEFKAKRKELK